MTISSTDTSTYFRQTENRYKKYAMKRSRHYEREEELSDKIKSGVGAVIGTAVPMAIMMKKRGIKNPLKLKNTFFKPIFVFCFCFSYCCQTDTTCNRRC